MFLKAKNVNSDEAVLIAVSQIAYVEADGKNTLITLRDENVIQTNLGIQSVVNRLKDLGAEVA